MHAFNLIQKLPMNILYFPYRTGDTVQHFKILRDSKGGYYLWNEKFSSIDKLVSYHRENSVSNTQIVYLNDMNTVGSHLL